jgi:hypothetical protein
LPRNDLALFEIHGEPTSSHLSILARDNFLSGNDSNGFYDDQNAEENSKIHWVSVFSEGKTHATRAPDAKTISGFDDATQTAVSGLSRYVFYYDSDRGCEVKHALLEGIFKVGRAKTNDLVIADAAASRSHFHLEIKPGAVELVDLSSGNGTRVNGSRVSRQVLQNGDRIDVGRRQFYYRTSDRSPKRVEEATSLASFNDNDHTATRDAEAHTALGEDRFEPQLASSLSVDFEATRLVTLHGTKAPWKAPTRDGKTKRVFFSLFVILGFASVVGSAGVLIFQLIERQKNVEAAAYYEVLLRATRLAALGNLEFARSIQTAASSLLKENTRSSKELEASNAFLQVIDTLRNADAMAASGRIEEAIHKLKDVQIELLPADEAALVEKAIVSRETFWTSSNQSRMGDEQKALTYLAAEAKRHDLKQDLDPAESWAQAVSMYRAQRKNEACALVKRIVDSDGVPASMLRKANTFLTRKCGI